MSAPPVEPPELEGMRAVRHAFEEIVTQQPKAARDEVKRYLNSDEMAQKVAALIIPAMDKRFDKRYWPRIILGVGGLFILVLILAIIGINIISAQQATTNARFQSQDAALQRSQDTIAAFQAQLESSNKQLIAKGLQPVQGPTGVVEPGSVDQAKLINAAAVASTLTKVPDVTKISPADLAKAVADYVATNPITIPPDLIISGLATYLADHPIPAGPKGDTGPPPTADEIRAAFRDEVAANPQLLCPLGGVYGEKVLTLASGGTASQFGCFGPESAPPDTSPPPDTTQPQPQPTTDPVPSVVPSPEGATPTPEPTTAPPLAPGLFG